MKEKSDIEKRFNTVMLPEEVNPDVLFIGDLHKQCYHNDDTPKKLDLKKLPYKIFKQGVTNEIQDVFRRDDGLCFKRRNQDIVDRAGFITRQQQIENFKLAGKRLEIYRGENYPNDIEFDMRTLSYLDFGEIHEQAIEYTARAQRQREKAEYAAEMDRKANEAKLKYEEELAKENLAKEIDERMLKRKLD